MQYTVLSGTDISVSRICLGTMGYGYQVNEEDAHAQLAYALEHGVQFWDTAEMYPVPATKERYGHTESIIGRYLQKTGKRSEVILASKILGPDRYHQVERSGAAFSEQNICSAIEGSLRRLQTDYLDLYQLHWPDRSVNAFGQRGYVYQSEEEITPIVETLRALSSAVESGKIRYVGLSNETPWGTMEFLRLAQSEGLPLMVSVQNVYNLLNRHYEIGMAEVSLRENIGLLAYSPLAFGVLGGRYFNGAQPAGGRFTLHPDFVTRYRTPHVEAITKEYANIAANHGLSLATLSLAFVNQQPFVTSNIIGASTLEQLKEDIASITVTLDAATLQAIETVHERYPNPCA